MKRGILTYMLAVGVWLFSAMPAFAGTQVTGVYFSTSGAGTVVTFTLKGDITRHKAFTMDKPDRLIIDIADGEWNVPGNSATGKSPLVKDLRSGTPENGILRIVMEVTRKVEVISDDRSGNTLSVKFAPAEKLGALAPSSGSSEPKSMRKGYGSGSSLSIPGYEKSIFKKKGEAASASTARSPVTRKPVIVIDAGHGGMDPGATGKSGIYEKKITLQYALALKKLLESSGKYKVYLTRSDDHYVDLGERVKKARGWKGDLFISLHADSHKDSDTRGLSVYTISEDRAQRETDKLYDKAGQTEVIRGVNLKGEDKEVQGVLLDLARRANTNTAATFAEMLVQKMGNNAKLLDHTHRQKSLAVLTDIDITSVLIELGYLSNRYEEKQLRTDAYRATLTTGIRNAIDDYFTRFPLQE